MMSSGRALALMGLGLLAVVSIGVTAIITGITPTPASAGLPPVSAGELITSVRQARPGPMSGTVRVAQRLGLSVLSLQPAFSSGDRTARLWCDGTGKRRISLPTSGGERTIVNDGTTMWTWNSATRTITHSPAPAEPAGDAQTFGRFSDGELLGNPVDAASALLAMLEPSSVVRVDPTDVVAHRPAYELVLDPLPTERTMLREVRVAVDGQTRLPLEVTVLANGSSEPALRVGFSDISFGPQDPALFAFHSPTVTADQVLVRRSRRAMVTRPPAPSATVIGSGWDTVMVRRVPQLARRAGSNPALDRLSHPISGSWGAGRLVSTAIGNALITSDGRMAMGAVPTQVLTEALAR